MVASLVPVAASAVSFGALHIVLKRGRCFKALQRVFQKRKEAGDISPNASTKKLASQAEARIVNEVHNVIVKPTRAVQIPMAIAALFQQQLNRDRMHGVTPYARWLSLISAGYFITDICIVAKHFQEHGVEPLCHAIICITFFGFSAAKRRMQYFVPRVLLFECSTPFVHARWLLHALGKSKTKLYKKNGIAMLVSFFLFRPCYGTKVIYDFFQARNAYLRNPPKVREPITRGTMNVITTAGCGISALNWFWFYKMCRGAFKVFRRPTSSQASLASANNIPAPSDPEQTPGAGDTTRVSPATAAQDAGDTTRVSPATAALGGVPENGGALLGPGRGRVRSLEDGELIDAVDIPAVDAQAYAS